MALWGNHILRFFHAVFNTALMARPWPWKAKKKREGGAEGIWDLVVVAPIHQWNLTLCPDGTKSGLQLMGTSPSSKGHLAGISHTPPHTHKHTHTHTHTHETPDMHMQTGLVRGLLTLLCTVTWLSSLHCCSFTCFHIVPPCFYRHIRADGNQWGPVWPARCFRQNNSKTE